jgi:hypothetical protein
MSMTRTLPCFHIRQQSRRKAGPHTSIAEARSLLFHRSNRGETDKALIFRENAVFHRFHRFGEKLPAKFLNGDGRSKFRASSPNRETPEQKSVLENINDLSVSASLKRLETAKRPLKLPKRTRPHDGQLSKAPAETTA